MSVHRYSGAFSVSPVGNSDSANTNGVGDTSCTGGTNSSSYTFSTLDTTSPNSVVFVGVANMKKAHTPGAGYTERVEVGGGSGAPAVGVAVEDKLFDTPTTNLTVDGTLQTSADWAVVALEIKAIKIWDGGAGTNNWGDGNNWDPDGVPTSDDSIQLT